MKVGKLMALIVGAAFMLTLVPQENVSAYHYKQLRQRKVLVNATITEINGKIINVTKDSTTYTVDATNARIVRKFDAKADFSEVLTGDIINVWGTLDGTTVTARKIKDLSIQKAHGVFSGTIKSIDSTAKTFVLQSNKRGDQTAHVTDSTRIKQKGQTKAFADLQVGNNIQVKGTWNKTHNKIYNVNWVKIKK